MKLSSAYWQLHLRWVGWGGVQGGDLRERWGVEEGSVRKKINKFRRMLQVISMSYGMVEACLSFGRLRQLDEAMNHGYNLKVAALADASSWLTLENAAARGNPFAASAISKRHDTSSNTFISGACPDQRLRQLNASMNEGYSERLATMSPTRMQAAARGNPFAIFETNSWKSPGTRLQPPKLGKDVETGSKLAAPAVTSLLAHAAAQGNPFALSAASHTKNLAFAKTNENVKKGFVANTKSKVEGQRLEASIIFERIGHQVATTAQSESTQKKVQKPLNLQNSSSIGARSSKTPAPKQAKRSAKSSQRAVVFDTLDTHFSDNETENPLGNLLDKRLPNHADLSITLPASPSESTRLRSPPHADEACAGDEVCLHPARDCPTVSNGDSSVEAAVGGSSAALVASSTDKLEPFDKSVEQLGGPCLTILHQTPATAIDDAFFSLDLESQIRLLRKDLSGCGGDSSAGAAASAVVNEVQDVTCVMSARRSSSRQGGALEEDQDCPDLSPKTLFLDQSDYTTLAETRVPEEESLACMVQQSLHLRHEVAVMVAGYMRETVRRNTAASADFRANYRAQALHQPEICSTGTGACQTLVMVERAMRLQAVADAEKLEETFHRKVADTQRKMK